MAPSGNFDDFVLVIILHLSESWIWGIVIGLVSLLLFLLVFITVGCFPKEALCVHSTFSQARKENHREDGVRLTLCEPSL